MGLGFDILAVAITFCIVLYTWFQWSYQYWKRRNVPYLEPSFPFGNINPPLNSKELIGEEIARLCRQAKANGKKVINKYLYTKQ